MKGVILLAVLAVLFATALADASGDDEKDGYYKAHGRCYNCGTMVEYEVPKGIPVDDYEDLVDCPNCGCMNRTPPLHGNLLQDPDGGEPQDENNQHYKW